MNILVVDDDVVSRMVLMHLIDACGKFDITEAEDGQEAWELLEQGLRPLVCFCDLRMPRMSGLDLLAKIRASEALAAIPFVLVTSATDRSTIDQAQALQVAGYLVKPFEGDEVRQCLAPYLAHCGSAELEAEAPRATMERLGISAERLLVYLGGFQSQLTGASADIAALLAQGDHEGARLRLERLNAGCLTLGLSGAGAALRGFAPGVLDAGRVQVVLADTVRAVMHQSDALKRSS